jgi:hypothetical protein
MMLEQLYEKRYQRPLMDKEDSLFRLLNRCAIRSPDFAATIARLQSYERQYRPMPQEALAALTERLRQPEVEEQTWRSASRCCTRSARTASRGATSPGPRAARARERMATELAAREAARRDTLAIIAGEIEQSLQHDERLQAVLRELGRQPREWLQFCERAMRATSAKAVRRASHFPAGSQLAAQSIRFDRNRIEMSGGHASAPVTRTSSVVCNSYDHNLLFANQEDEIVWKPPQLQSLSIHTLRKMRVTRQTICHSAHPLPPRQLPFTVPDSEFTDPSDNFLT